MLCIYSVYLLKLCLVRQKSTASFSFSGAREEQTCTEDGTVLVYILGFLIVLIMMLLLAGLTDFNCLDIFELVCCLFQSVFTFIVTKYVKFKHEKAKQIRLSAKKKGRLSSIKQQQQQKEQFAILSVNHFIVA